MRVITGTARGRKLNTLEGRDVRPTTDQVKEAMFSIIQLRWKAPRCWIYLPAADSWALKR